MGGGLMQLVDYGAKDIYLTGNTQITFFKVVYRRHTNFAIESIAQTFNGTADFGKKVTVTVSRNGDLVSQVYLQCAIPDIIGVGGSENVNWNAEVGHFIINSVEVEIGGQRIDKHYGTWLSIWSALTLANGHTNGYNSMIGNTGALTTPSTSDTSAATIYVPLQFWFNRNPGLALPLIALQYHEVKFNIEFAAFADVTTQNGGTPNAAVSLGDTSLWIDYIYLDTDERRRFAQTSHEYLIEQLQFTGDESLSGANNKVKLNFNHPVKEMIWVVQDDNISGNNFTDANGASSSTANGNNPISTAKLQLNGHDRFAQRAGTYFNWVQPYQCHTNIPRSGINVYSFGIKPEEHQPSGTANMSRIDNATLSVNITSDAVTNTGNIIKVYAVNYNVLRIMSGMGGLAYSN